MSTQVRAELAGAAREVVAREGTQVGPEDVLLVLESMKMEIPMLAETSGTLQSVAVAVGALVQEGDVLAVVG